MGKVVGQDHPEVAYVANVLEWAWWWMVSKVISVESRWE